MRAVLLWILVLHTLHLPIPCPDLDGECRGTSITSFTEPHAWHVLILGVRPNDDIDRGPFRTGDQNDRAPTESSFGDAGVSPNAESTAIRSVWDLPEPRFLSHPQLPLVDTARAFRERKLNRSYERSRYSRTYCVRCSVWLI